MVTVWRLAYHLHMRDADAYGGANAAPDVYYLLLAAVYTILATSAGFGILWWRGLPAWWESRWPGAKLTDRGDR